MTEPTRPHTVAPKESTETGESVATQAATQQPPTKNENIKSAGLTPLMMDMFVYIVVAAAVSFAMMRYGPEFFGERKSDSAKYVVINLEDLSREHIIAMSKNVQAGKMTIEDMSNKTREFSEKLMAKAGEYAEEGAIVLNSNAVVYGPLGTIDVTDIVRKELQKNGAMAVADDVLAK